MSAEAAGWVLLVVLSGLACVLVGYRLAWLDAYHKGRRDALAPFRPIPIRPEWFE